MFFLHICFPFLSTKGRESIDSDVTVPKNTDFVYEYSFQNPQKIAFTNTHLLHQLMDLEATVEKTSQVLPG